MGAWGPAWPINISTWNCKGFSLGHKAAIKELARNGVRVSRDTDGLEPFCYVTLHEQQDYDFIHAMIWMYEVDL